MEDFNYQNKYSDVFYYKWDKGNFIEHKGPKNNFCYPVALNPFKILELTINSSDFEAELKFKQKLFEEKNYRSEISLAYEILIEPNLMDSFTYVKKDNNDDKYYVLEYTAFYCAIVGDYQGLANHIIENKSILYSRDKHGRPLLYIAARNGHYKVCEILLEYGADVNFPTDKGSTPLHAASYHGHEDIINLLISYGADINKKNEFGLTPSDNAATNRYKELIISSQNDRILNLYTLLASEKLVDKIIKVKKYNINTKTDDFIAIKFIPSFQILPENFQEVRKNWAPAWHGTKFNCLESILKNGLKESGSIIKDFGQITPQSDHIQVGVKFCNLNDWSQAVFTSPSIFYSTHTTYSERIDSKFYKERYAVLIEARLKPGAYQTFKSTTARVIVPGEPTLIEYRVKSVDKYNNKNIYVISVTFVLENFINNAKAYDQGDILSNSEAERIVFDD
jgi:hypothetical protein